MFNLYYFFFFSTFGHWKLGLSMYSHFFYVTVHCKMVHNHLSRLYRQQMLHLFHFFFFEKNADDQLEFVNKSKRKSLYMNKKKIEQQYVLFGFDLNGSFPFEFFHQYHFPLKSSAALISKSKRKTMSQRYIKRQKSLNFGNSNKKPKSNIEAMRRSMCLF